MPISANYSWSEKKDSIKLSIPLKGVSPTKVDIFVSESTIKVNFSPYILDLILNKEIYSTKHKAVVKDGMLLISLYKKETLLWGTLEAEGNMEVLANIKKESLLAQEVLNQTLIEQQKDRKIDEEKHALRKQMKLEEIERNLVDSLKLDEKEAAEKEVYEVFAEMNKQSINHKKPVVIANQLKNDTKHTNIESNTTATLNDSNNNVVASSLDKHIDLLLDADDIDDVTPTSTYSPSTIYKSDDKYNPTNIEDIKPYDYNDEDDEVEDRIENNPQSIRNNLQPHQQQQYQVEEEEVRYIPPPRSTGLSINANQKKEITFTPRVFPTPMRESKAAEEEDWVAKNRRHLKKHGVLGKNNAGDISEEDPVWLKAKGDDFFRSGDIRSALNAYSAALDIDHTMLPCLSNRTVCYLRLNMPNESKIDCTAGIKLIMDEINITSDSLSDDGKVISGSLKASKNGGLLIKLLMRRGTANCLLGLFTEALIDYHQASTRYQQISVQQIHSIPGVTVESLTFDIQRLKLLVDADSLKKQGDTLFAEQNLLEALVKYNESLQLVPVHVSCLSNRAACKMATHDLIGCIDDCSVAVTLLRNESSNNSTLTSSSLLQTNNHLATLLHKEQYQNMLNAILPPIGSEKRTSWMVKTLLRRGIAHTQLKYINEAIIDYEQALLLDPHNEAIQNDVIKLKSILQSNLAE